MSERIEIGRIAKAQGVKGEVKVTVMYDELNLFKKLTKVSVGDKEYKVESVKNLSNGVFFKLEGVNDRNIAESMRGAVITCQKCDLPKLPKGRYLVVDLIGCSVYVDNVLVGKLADILQNGSADVYCVEGDKSFMFPCLKTVLAGVDVEQKRIDLNREILEQIAVYED